MTTEPTGSAPAAPTEGCPTCGGRKFHVPGCIVASAPAAPTTAEMDYPRAAISLHLNLAEFCDESERYPLMIANAGRRAAKEIESLRASLADARRDTERNQRIVDLVCAPGSLIQASSLTPGRVVVIDGRTGLDACERSASECFDVLFEEADGGASPGRIGITFTPARAAVPPIEEGEK